MTHPDLVERLKAAIATFPGTKWYGGYHPGPNVPRDLLVDLQSSLAEQEKTISKLREEVKEARRQVQSQLAEARNSGLEEVIQMFPDEHANTVLTYRHVVAAIRSLKSQAEKKGE